MSELIEFLIRQPLILIFLAIWLLSGLGKLGQKAAKRVAEQQAAQRREERHVQRELSSERRSTAGVPPEAPPQPAPQQPRHEQPSPDEIAAEIRRMMGMEEPEQPEPVMVHDDPVAESPPVLRHVRHVGHAAPTAAVERLRPSLPDVSLPMGSTSSSRGRSRHATGRGHGRLNLRDPAAVIVAMEALGPPVALR